MADRVLVPVDDLAYARRACAFAVREFPDATVVLLHVVNPAEAGYGAQASVPGVSDDWLDTRRTRAESLFDDLLADVAAPDAAVERVVEVGKPTRAIVDYAAEHDVDLIVMGSHAREGVSRILLGSVAETVVRRSPVPVTVTR